MAASRQSGANCDGNSNGGFLPKAATPKADLSRRNRMKADGAQPQTGRVVSALCADTFEPQARRYIRILNSAGATDSFPESILGGRLGQGAFELMQPEDETMSDFLKCDCPHCGQPIEYPAEGVGQTVPCPTCENPFVLLPSNPPTSLAPDSDAISPVMAVRKHLGRERHRHRVGQAGCIGGAGGEWAVAGECQLRGKE